MTIDNGWETASPDRVDGRAPRRQTHGSRRCLRTFTSASSLVRSLSLRNPERAERTDRRARWRSPIRNRGVYPPTPPDVEDDEEEDERVTSTSRRLERRLERERDRERR